MDHIDLTRGAADLAIRTQFPTEPELVSLHCALSQPAAYASKEYAATLTQPCDWPDIQWISCSKPYTTVQPRPMLERLISGFEPVFCSDNYLVQKAAFAEGLGAMIINCRPDDSLQKGGRVPIDAGGTLPQVESYIVCAKSMQHVPRLMAVVKHLIACL